GEAFDLRCAVRERMIDFLARHHPYALPRLRVQIDRDAGPAAPWRGPAPGAPASPRAADGGAAAAPPAWGRAVAGPWRWARGRVGAGRGSATRRRGRCATGAPRSRPGR